MDAIDRQGAVAEGLATIGAGGKVLDSWFPRPRLENGVGACATERLSHQEAVAALGDDVVGCLGRDPRRDVEVVAIRTRVPSLRKAPVDAHDVFLRTMSGGGTVRITVGKRCLIGANAGIGISLGDDCVVEAGCYVTAGARVRWVDGTVVKARELSGRPGLMFWRNSQTGALEVIVREKIWGKLNPELHSVA